MHEVKNYWLKNCISISIIFLGRLIKTHQRKNPFLTIQDELDKAINSFNQWFDFPSFTTANFESLNLFPSIDVVDNKDALKVEVEMPGMGKEDIKVAIDNWVLTIKGEKSTSKEDKDRNYLMREINYGRYERSVRLPDSIDASKAKASFKKGMLWVMIPYHHHE